MKKIIIPLFAAMGALILAAPASSAPSFISIAPQAPAAVSKDVVEVQHRRGHRDHRRHDRFERRGGHTYWRGHRGYRHARPGYRRHGDFWFPPAAFALGAIVGGAIAAQEPPIRYRPRGNAHIQWCYNQYRSYRASDNTFQPYNGPRRQCRSPHG